MTTELRSLQAKYLNGADTLSREEVERFITLLEGDAGAPFREERIPALERRLRDIERQERLALEEKSLQAFYVDCGRKFRVITDSWAKKGVEKRQLMGGYADAWFYEGREILRMYGAMSRQALSIDELLAEAQRIDKEVFGREGD